MGKKPRHPDVRLFEYLSGSVEPGERQKTEQHLAECEECASVAALIRTLKRERAECSRISEEHPDVSELAAFFYAKSARRDSGRVAAHVALCRSCADEIAQYARADYAASRYEAAKAAAGEVPAKAWEMIRDWEDSGLAKIKPASDVLSQELLDKLSRVLKARERVPLESRHVISGSQAREPVPVLVISQSGEVQSVEYFQEDSDATGAKVLRHTEGSERFDNKAVHLLLDAGEKEPLVVSNLIHRDTIRFEEAKWPEERSRRQDYVIIED